MKSGMKTKKGKHGKLALITGGASGLGLAMAKKFIEEDIECLLLGRDREKLINACDILGPAAHAIVFDLSQLSEIPALIQEISKNFSPINILVNNAGIHLKKDMLDHSDSDFQNVIQTNQLSVFSLSREVARLMKENGGGAILHIGSMASIYGIPKVIAYTAAKSAIEGMTRAMAVELAPMGIRVNCLAPGFIRTEMSAGALDSDPSRMEKVLSRTPLHRLGNPEELAEAAFFLVSDAASYITGVVLPVDGGNSIGF
jgi:NAD(P)-dependent dehydrogenase (short-subunit alcohol dehydrogenase family)